MKLQNERECCIFMVYQQKREQTELLIKESLLDLLKTQEIHTINVSSIAQRAGVNRVTIYRYFADKWEILESIEGDVLASLVHPHKALQKGLQENASKEEVLQALTDFLTVIQRQLDTLQILTSYQSHLGFSNKLLKFLIELEKTSHPYIHQRLAKPAQELFSYTTVSLFLGVIEYWIQNPTITAEELASFLFDVRVGAIRQLNQKNPASQD